MWFPEVGVEGGGQVGGGVRVESDMWIAWKFTSRFRTDLWRLYEKFFKKSPIRFLDTLG